MNTYSVSVTSQGKQVTVITASAIDAQSACDYAENIVNPNSHKLLCYTARKIAPVNPLVILQLERDELTEAFFTGCPDKQRGARHRLVTVESLIRIMLAAQAGQNILTRY